MTQHDEIRKWAEIKSWITRQEDREIQLLGVDYPVGDDFSKSIRANEGTYLGAYLRSCGGIIVEQGKIRLLGCALDNSRYRNLLRWNSDCGEGISSGKLLIADDVFGNYYCLNLGGIKGAQLGGVCALYADELGWMDIDTTFIDFISWLITGDLSVVFEDFPISDHELYGSSTSVDNFAFNYYPPLFSQEGGFLTSDRKLVSAKENYLLKSQFVML